MSIIIFYHFHSLACRASDQGSVSDETGSPPSDIECNLHVYPKGGALLYLSQWVKMEEDDIDIEGDFDLKPT